MKKLKYVFIIALVFMLGLTNVFAEGPNPETSELVVGGKVLYQKGQKTDEFIPGASFDDTNMTLLISSELNTNGDGIKIIDMGDTFTLLVDGNVSYEVNERNDGIFINNTFVTIRTDNNGGLKITPSEGSGIVVDGSSELHIKNVGIDVVSVRFKDVIVDITDETNVSNTIFYKNDGEISLDDIRLVTTENAVYETPQETTNDETPRFKRRDSFKDVAVYAIVAGLLVVGGIVVILMAVKNQKK